MAGVRDASENEAFVLSLCQFGANLARLSLGMKDQEAFVIFASNLIDVMLVLSRYHGRAGFVVVGLRILRVLWIVLLARVARVRSLASAVRFHAVCPP